LTYGHQYLRTLATIDGFSAFDDHPLLGRKIAGYNCRCYGRTDLIVTDFLVYYCD
jgi:hypothetical protein